MVVATMPLIWIRGIVERKSSSDEHVGDALGFLTLIAHIQMITSFFLLTGLLHLSRGDLPVHCELDDIVGEWTIWESRVNDLSLVPSLPMKMNGEKFCSGIAGKPTYNSDLMGMSASPDLPTSFTIGLARTQKVHATSNRDVGDFERHELVVADPHKFARGDQTPKGEWTTFFDEGFEFRIENRSYLAISKYICDPSEPAAWCKTDKDAHESSDGSTVGWVSKCGETFLGWYHEVDPETSHVTGLGCWVGKRTPGPAPEYLLKPVVVVSSFLNRSLRKSVLGPDTVPNSCDIDEGIENVGVEKSVPTSFSWKDQFPEIAWQSPVTTQGDCGSCYAVAAVYALQSRANLLLAKEGINAPIELSIQSVVSCSWYNQGCDGGLELLVHRHAKEAGVPQASCMEYTSGGSGVVPRCDSSCYSDESELVFAKDYGYMGGFNGQCSETRLLRNLYEYGPVTVAVNVANARVGSLDGIPAQQVPGRGDTDTIAMKLRGPNMGQVMADLVSHPLLGQFLSKSAPEVTQTDDVGFLFLRASKVNKNVSNVVQILQQILSERNRIDVELLDVFTLGIHGWEYIDHSIVLVGYGVNPDGTKYWTIRNSWGGNTPFGAYVNIDRGNDVGAVESGAVWVQPDPCRGKLAKILKAHNKYNKYC
jgi:hypothetical protein